MSEHDPQAGWRRILLTGGTGFVGSYLAPALAAAFPTAQKLILRRPGETVLREGWDTLDAELNAGDMLGEILFDFAPDLILHLAAQASVGEGINAPEQTWRVNRDGTLALAAACGRLATPPTFVFASTSEVYGDRCRGGAASGSTPWHPMNAYAGSKAAAEAGLATALPEGARLIILRPFNHTGVGQDLRFVLPSLVAQVAEIESGKRLAMLEVGNLDAVRDFLDVRDVCNAYLAVLGAAPQLPKLRADGAEFSVFNIASGEPRRIGDCVEILRRLARTPFEVAVDPARLRPGETPVAVGSSARLEALTGWRPRVPMEQTLGEMLEHRRRNRP